jgi:hypothetical protein
MKLKVSLKEGGEFEIQRYSGDAWMFEVEAGGFWACLSS